ncbi:DZI1L protein, partial [Nycticryphes semicollaris]|nr:DZI1L protein [Nycticryphes semicollaris]
PLHRVIMPGPSLGLTIPAHIPSFRFQPRRLPVDWRRFGAVDVEQVAREVDLAALQDHIAAVTFCDLDGERCPHCGQLADPILLKVLRMAQLSIEYLLHCQESLGTSLALHAQQLEDAHAELACTQQRAAEQAAQLRGVKEESRRWKKLLATQQILLQAGLNAYCKVRGFFTPPETKSNTPTQPTAHPGAGRSPFFAHDTPVFPGLFAERQRRKPVEDEVEELKAKLRETQQQLEVEREAGKMRREQEEERARQREEEDKRDLEKWKEEERTKLHKEIDGLRQLFLTVFQDMASRNSAMEGKLQELQAREAEVSNLGTLQDDDTEEVLRQIPRRAELQGEQEELAVQVSSAISMSLPLPRIPGGAFGWKLNQNGGGSLSFIEGCSLLRPNGCLFWDWWDPKRRVLPTPSPGQGTCVSELVPAPIFTPDREEAALGGKQRLLEALRRNPNLLKQFRPILEEVLEEKLEGMGVKKVAKGISTRTYKSLQALVRLQRQQKAEKFPGLLHLRDELVRAVMRKVRRCKKASIALPRQLSIIPGDVAS